jgi:hypothetical protein
VPSKKYDVDALTESAEEFYSMLNEYAALRSDLDPKWKLEDIDGRYEIDICTNDIHIDWMETYSYMDTDYYSETIPIAHLKATSWTDAIRGAMAAREEGKRLAKERKEAEELAIVEAAHETTEARERAQLKELLEKYGDWT